MLTLALDTSNVPLSVAVIREQLPIAVIQTAHAKNHSTTLMPAIDQALKLAQVKLAEIDQFVVAVGPGSYTGVRIAVTTAKTLAWTLAKPLYAVSSLAALTTPWRQDPQQPLIVPLVDARRNCFFSGFYRWQATQLTSLAPDAYLAFDQIVAQIKQLAAGEVVLTGQLTSEQTQAWQQALPDQQVVIAQGLNAQPQAGNFGQLIVGAQPVADLNALVPNYLRPTEAETNWLQQHPHAKKTNYVEQV